MVKTITLHLDLPSDRTLHITLPPDVPTGPLDLVLVIASTAPPPTTTPSLAGRWQAYFPEDFDVESTLQELRHGWEQEWVTNE